MDKNLKIGDRVIGINNIDGHEIRGVLGTVTNIISDTDCIVVRFDMDLHYNYCHPIFVTSNDICKIKE